MVCRILLARLEYLRDTFQIKEGDFLTFDALVLFHCPLSIEQLLFWLSCFNILFLCNRLIFLPLDFTGAETGCSMCGPSDPVKG